MEAAASASPCSFASVPKLGPEAVEGYFFGLRRVLSESFEVDLAMKRLSYF